MPLTAFANPGNKAFYGKDGAFSQINAKKAYFDMMKSFGYPIQKKLQGDDFWVCDFVQRDYEKLGMAGIFVFDASDRKIDETHLIGHLKVPEKPEITCFGEYDPDPP